MTVLSDVKIQKYIKEGLIRLVPYDQSCLNGAGYDLRVESEVTIPPGQHRLVATLERVELAENLVGTLHIRSSLARAGIFASLALIDPGFRGQLTISLYNGSMEPLIMKRGDRFIQVAFHLLGTKASRSYQGRYQDSQGIVHRRR